MLAVLVASVLGQSTDPSYLFIQDKYVRVGVKLDSGAAIAWISGENSEKNLVNDFDHGRMIQQSYYGAPDGSLWNDKPWVWNPVQGGDWRGDTNEPLEIRDSKTSIYSRCYARNWGGCNMLDDVILEQWVSLEGEVVHVHYALTYNGRAQNPLHDQEMPAVFLQPNFDWLVIYQGDKPWTGDKITKNKPGFPNESREMTEHWAAYVDSTDFGLGVYQPSAKELTCYRAGSSETDPSACSYFAPLENFAVLPRKTVTYDAYIAIGTSQEIRKQFYRLAHKKWRD
ncbi:MAG TPA: hypothetical protein VGL56_18210 [Fimbriimonadaceae bacterium]|jgi:hypothetical protein